MFLVDTIETDTASEVIAAPADRADLDGRTVAFLQTNGFVWDDGEEKFTAPAGAGDPTELAVDTAIGLASLGHAVRIH